MRWLWLLVPLFVIWTNAHGGFVAGFCILAAYLGLRCLELLMAQGRQAWPTIGLLAALATATGLATLFNPYGWKLHHWLLQSLGARRPEILEWLPPELFSPVWPAWWLLVAMFVAATCWCHRRRRDLTHLAHALLDAVAGVRASSPHRVLCHPVRVLDAGPCPVIAGSACAESRGQRARRRRLTTPALSTECRAAVALWSG